MSLEYATGLLAAKGAELEAKGYPPRLVELALERARGSAEQKTAPIRGSIRTEAFCDILAAELAKAETYIDGLLPYTEGN